MGNQTCCNRQTLEDVPPTLIILPVEKGDIVQTLPTISSAIESFLKTEKPYDEELSKRDANQCKIIKIGDDFYHGALSQDGKPEGYAQYYKQDGSLFISKFQHGEMIDNVYCILPNGSYFYGTTKNNLIDRGKFIEDNFIYEGGFTFNLFHTEGKQSTNDYQFEGTYNYGKRVTGKLTWQQDNFECTYEGSFNSNNRFHGYGELTQSEGVYRGNFVNGVKHGHGLYKFTDSGLTYTGDYFEGKKQGKGKLLNADKTTCYEGEFLNDLPHGTGLTYKEHQAVTTEFQEGIPKTSFQKLQVFESKQLESKGSLH